VGTRLAEHWRSLSRTVKRSILEKMMLGVRVHTGPGIPKALRLAQLRLRIQEVEAEPDDGIVDERAPVA
jgi:hypothetical protein